MEVAATAAKDLGRGADGRGGVESWGSSTLVAPVGAAAGVCRAGLVRAFRIVPRGGLVRQTEPTCGRPRCRYDRARFA